MKKLIVGITAFFANTRFAWTIHNLIAHPLSEIFWLVGLERASDAVHDWTIPEHEKGTGRG